MLHLRRTLVMQSVTVRPNLELKNKRLGSFHLISHSLLYYSKEEAVMKHRCYCNGQLVLIKNCSA